MGLGKQTKGRHFNLFGSLNLRQPPVRISRRMPGDSTECAGTQQAGNRAFGKQQGASFISSANLLPYSACEGVNHGYTESERHQAKAGRRAAGDGRTERFCPAAAWRCHAATPQPISRTCRSRCGSLKRHIIIRWRSQVRCMSLRNR